MTRGLNIAFFGSSLVSTYWNGAATYYRGIIRALHDLGHQVTFYEPDAYDRQRHRDMPDAPWATVVVYFGVQENEVFKVLQAAASATPIISDYCPGLERFFTPNLGSVGPSHTAGDLTLPPPAAGLRAFSIGLWRSSARVSSAYGRPWGGGA